jgi:hypothetical protein
LPSIASVPRSPCLKAGFSREALSKRPAASCHNSPGVSIQTGFF